MLCVVLSLTAVLFFGAKAYKRSSDRAACVMNIHSVQNAVRSFSNLHGLAPGQTLPGTDLRAELVGPDRYLEQAPHCPGGGTYSYLANRIPKHGELFLTCTLSGEERHAPERISSW